MVQQITPKWVDPNRIHANLNMSRKRKKMVIRGRNFLSIHCNCLGDTETGNTFRFLNRPSLSIVGVKKKTIVMNVDLLDTHSPSDVSLHVKADEVLEREL